MKNTVSEIIDFLESNNDSALVDHVKNDLKIKNVDSELSQIFDMVDEKKYDVSLEEIVDATLKRIIIAIETFK